MKRGCKCSNKLAYLQFSSGEEKRNREHVSSLYSLIDQFFNDHSTTSELTKQTLIQRHEWQERDVSLTGKSARFFLVEGKRPVRLEECNAQAIKREERFNCKTQVSSPTTSRRGFLVFAVCRGVAGVAERPLPRRTCELPLEIFS